MTAGESAGSPFAAGHDSVVRTPDHRFDRLPGYPWEPRYVEVDGFRMHYVDDGPADAHVVLLLHGEPTWSYLYRKMIPVLTDAGLRAVAPDLPGFGRSDKPADPSACTYARFVAWAGGFMDALGLRDATLFGHDWGGLIGLRLAAERDDRFSRIVVANTALPTGDRTPNLAFRAWRWFALATPVLPIGLILRAGCRSWLPRAVVRAYEAPFPSARHKLAARRLPALVPVRPDDPASQPNREAWERLRRWERPFLTLFSDGDPFMRGIDRRFQRDVPGAAGQPHAVVRGAGHFLQEDRGEEVAGHIVRWLGS